MTEAQQERAQERIQLTRAEAALCRIALTDLYDRLRIEKLKLPDEQARADSQPVFSEVSRLRSRLAAWLEGNLVEQL